MAEIKCPNCGKEVSGDYEFCPHCGSKMDNTPQTYVIAKRLPLTSDQTTAIVLIVCGAFLAPIVVGIVLIIIGALMLNKEKTGLIKKHDCAYYQEDDGKIHFYNENDEELVADPIDVTGVQHYENDELVVTVSGKEFRCGKCSASDTQDFENYLNQIKAGTFKGL